MTAWDDARAWLRAHNPVHGPRQAAIAVLLIVPMLAFASIVYRGHRSASVPHLTAPKGASPGSLPPLTTGPTGDPTQTPLGSVRGTTSAVPVRIGGTAQITGTVLAPTGPSPGATVHVERLDKAAAYDVYTGADGKYVLANIAGGGYRVRAFQPPSLAQAKPVTFFLTDGQVQPQDLTMDAVPGVSVASAVAPDPTVKQPFTLVVRVTTSQVGPDGIVRSTPVVGASVVLSSSSALQVQGSSASVTNLTGDAAFTVTCTTSGPLGAQVLIQPVGLPEQSSPLSLPDCAPAPAPPTVPPSSSSSSSSSSGTTTTTTVR